MYKGQIKDRKPNGKGYLINEHGTVYAEFKNGEKVQELKDAVEE